MRASLAWAVVALLAAGCATAQIEPKYRARGVAAPPDPAAPAVFVQVAEADVAPLYFQNGGGTRSARLTKPFGAFLKESLEQELTRMGWRPVDAVQKADGVLKGTAGKLSVVYKTFRFNHLGFVSEVALSLTMTSRGGVPVWAGDFLGSGQGEVTTPGMPGTAPQSIFNEALAEALDKVRPSLESSQVAARLTGRGAAAVAAVPPVSAAPKSDVDELPAAAAPKAKRHAVVVGIESYRESLPRADFAAGDAKLVAEYYRRVLGVPEENLALLLDDKASKSDLEKHFFRWLPNRVAEGDEVFVYFSGHGAPDTKSGDAFLVPYDGDPTYIEDTGFPLKRLYARLAQLPAKRVVIAMDSCFSGSGGRSVVAKGARPLMNVVETDVPGKLTVLAAAGGSQISNSYQEKGHGLFTYFLLKGLKQGGEDFRAAFDYLKPEVARVARRQFNADQEPQWLGGGR